MSILRTPFHNRSVLPTDDRAISPVIGVILMVSLAVLIATMIGGFTLNMGNNLTEVAPSAEFTFEYDANANTLAVTHEGGASFTTQNTQSLIIKQTGSTADSIVWIDGATGTFPVTAGDQLDTGFTLSSGDEVRVIWTSADGGSTSTVGQFEIP